MVDVTRSFTVEAAPDVVVGYLADFGNAVQWDPGTRSCVRDNDGPVAVGAAWQNVSVVRGRETSLRYRLERFDRDHVVLVGTNRTATSTDDITVERDPAGARVTYRARIRFHGLARLADPFLRAEFERLGDETVVGIRREVARLGAAGATPRAGGPGRRDTPA